MKKIKRKDKVKRGRIILSAILTFAIAVLSLGFGAYLGYITLNINYLTIGTMTYEVGGLLVVAGFFIFFGCAGGVISLKEIFISSRNEERFSAYKGALYSAIVYYVVIAIIAIAGIVSAMVNYIPSNYIWTIVALAVFAIILCGGAFYCVFRELKEHKKRKKATAEDLACANMELSAGDIHKLKDMSVKVDEENTKTEKQEESYRGEKQNAPSGQEERMKNGQEAEGIYQSGERRQTSSGYSDSGFYYKNFVLNNEEDEKTRALSRLDLYSLTEKLMQLEELKASGIISEREYYQIRSKII